MCPACTREFGTPPEHRNPVLHLLPLGPPWQPLSNHIQRSRSGGIKAATSDWGRSAPKIQIDPIHKNPAPIRARQQRLLKHPMTQRQSMPTQQLEAMSRRSWHSVRSAPRFRSGAHFYLTIRRTQLRIRKPKTRSNSQGRPSTRRQQRSRSASHLRRPKQGSDPPLAAPIAILQRPHPVQQSRQHPLNQQEQSMPKTQQQWPARSIWAMHQLESCSRNLRKENPIQTRDRNPARNPAAVMRPRNPIQ
ncbi:hypothetical protein ACLOJK_014186 [Asimina triloba]